jgi:hypothetical protein
MRDLLETHLFNQIVDDLAVLDDAVQNGENRETVIQQLTSNEAFEAWYTDLKNQAEQLLNR